MTHRTSNGTRNRGYMLIEILVYLIAFAMMINVMAVSFVSIKRVADTGDLAMERIEAIETVGEAFRQSVRKGRRVMDTIGPYTTGPGQLVVELAPGASGNADAPKYLVWGNVRFPDRLTKLVITKDQTGFRVEDAVTYRTAYDTYRFVPSDTGKHPTVRLEVNIDNSATENTVPARNTFIVAMRGTASP